MPVATSALTAIALGVAVAGTAYQVKSSIDAKNDAQDAAAKQAKDQQNNANDLKAKKDAEDRQAQQNQARALVGQGNDLGTRRSESIYTSPLGVAGNPLGGGKTAIGS